MAKAKTATTLSPEIFSTGQRVLSADAQAVAAQHGYVVGEVLEQASIQGYTDTTATEGSELGGAGVTIRAFDFRIRPAATDVVVEVVVDPDGGVTDVDVDVTIGSHTETLTYTSSTQPGAATISTASTGTGLVEVTVEGAVTGGTGAARLERLSLRTASIAAADLPDPS